MNAESMREALYSGVWGTIGPRFQEACIALGRKQGGAKALLMHSKTAAYETVLRALGIAHGDQVLCASCSDRMDAEVAAAIGAVPVFAQRPEGKPLSPECAEAALEASGEIRAVTLDYSEELDLPGMKRVCREHSCALILNAGETLDIALDYDDIYAAVFELGICGAAATGSQEVYVSLFGWHHCGHAPGTAESFSFDKILGGDMRVSEWQAIEAMEILKEVRR